MGFRGKQKVESENYAKELGRRIALAALRVGGKRALARKTGLLENQVHKYIKGKNVPAVSVIVDIARAAGVKIEWLAVGEQKVIATEEARYDEARFTIGEALRLHGKSIGWLEQESGIDSTEIEGFLAGSELDWNSLAHMAEAMRTEGGLPSKISQSLQRLQEVGDISYQILPKIDKHGREIPVTDSIVLSKAWLQSLGECIDISRLAIVEMPDDSMEPTLLEGDVLIVDLRATSYRGPGLYLLETDRRLKVRRIRRNTSGSLVVTSDYPELFEQGELASGSLSKMTLVGRVIWGGTRF